MDRSEALDRICREGVFMVAPLYAESITRAFGVTLDTIGVQPKTAKDLAREPLHPQQPGGGGMARVKHAHAEDKAVWMHEVAWRLALHFGLYASADHAQQTPYHRPASESRYLACRAGVRLARLFEGEAGVEALRERNPWMEARLFTEKPYTGTGVRLS